MKNKTLSEHIWYSLMGTEAPQRKNRAMKVIPVEDVKEFIKKLKEDISKDLDNSDFEESIIFAISNTINGYIDKLAGEELVE